MNPTVRLSAEQALGDEWMQYISTSVGSAGLRPPNEKQKGSSVMVGRITWDSLGTDTLDVAWSLSAKLFRSKKTLQKRRISFNMPASDIKGFTWLQVKTN